MARIGVILDVANLVGHSQRCRAGIGYHQDHASLSVRDGGFTGEWYPLPVPHQGSLASLEHDLSVRGLELDVHAPQFAFDGARRSDGFGPSIELSIAQPSGEVGTGEVRPQRRG